MVTMGLAGACFGSFIMLISPGLAAEDGAASLVGLWGSERVFGPEVRGELTLTRQGTEWHASIGSFEAPVRADNGKLSLALPGARGEFRGRLRRDEASIVG